MTDKAGSREKSVDSRCGRGKRRTAIDIKHIEHSEVCIDAVSPSFFGVVLLVRFRKRLCVLMLR